MGRTGRELRRTVFFSALAIDPSAPATLYAASGGVFKSTNGGGNWAEVGTGLTDVVALAVDPSAPETLYAADDPGRCLKEHQCRQDLDRIQRRPSQSSGQRPGHRSRGPGQALRRHEQWRLVHYLDTTRAPGPTDLSVGRDNRTHVLFTDPDSRALVRDFDNLGNSISGGPYGPFTGWYARAVADGSDGLTWVLWNNLDGSMQLQLLGPTGSEVSSYRYGPVAGWTAVDVSVGSNNTTQILWTNSDGRMGLWRLNPSGAVVGGAAFGPFPGWTARSGSHGADGLKRVLWSNTDGRVGLSLMDAGQIVATVDLRLAGMDGAGQAVASDNQARILFVNADGRIDLWSVDNSGAVTNSGTIYAPPPSAPPAAAIRVSAGADGLTRVLWTDRRDRICLVDGPRQRLPELLRLRGRLWWVLGLLASGSDRRVAVESKDPPRQACVSWTSRRSFHRSLPSLRPSLGFRAARSSVPGLRSRTIALSSRMPSAAIR